MKKARKRMIARVIKSHSISLMNQYFNNEQALAFAGVSIISDERELQVCDTLSIYAQILYRHYGEGSAIYKNEWASLLLDFY